MKTANITASARQNLQDLKISQGDENYIKRYLENNYIDHGVYVIDIPGGPILSVTASNNENTIYVDEVKK